METETQNPKPKEEPVVIIPVRKRRSRIVSDVKHYKIVMRQMLHYIEDRLSGEPISPQAMQEIFGAKSSLLSSLETLVGMHVKLDGVSEALAAPGSTAAPVIEQADVALIESFVKKMRGGSHAALV